MTTLLADITPWLGPVVPGINNPLFRAGPAIDMKGRRITETESPSTTVQGHDGLGENHLIKQLDFIFQY